jgi:xanthine dehydrogenase small subunit
MTLLDYIRYHEDLSGTKIGGREGDCGACTVLVGTPVDGSLHYLNVTSCLTPLGNVLGKHVVTIEGINQDQGLTPVQQFMVEEGGTQCGFCTVGFIVSMTGYCLNYSEQVSVLESIDGNICRCTGYKSIERAAHRLRGFMEATGATLQNLIAAKIVPSYFLSIPDRLANLTFVLPSGSGRGVAGGTDLYVQQHDTLVELDLSHLNYLNRDYIREQDGMVIVGANVTATQFCDSPTIRQYLPAMPEFKKLIASMPIRNISSIVGNLVNASPIADFANMLIALDATVVTSEDRSIALDRLYLDYKKLDLGDTEVIHEIRIPLQKWSHFNFEKVSKRTQLDIASVNSSIAIHFQEGTDSVVNHIRISAGGVYPYPLLLSRTSALIEGKPISAEQIPVILSTADDEISPISDVRGSAIYKRLLLRQLLLAHLHELLPHLDDAILEVIA